MTVTWPLPPLIGNQFLQYNHTRAIVLLNQQYMHFERHLRTLLQPSTRLLFHMPQNGRKKVSAPSSNMRAYAGVPFRVSKSAALIAFKCENKTAKITSFDQTVKITLKRIYNVISTNV